MNCKKEENIDSLVKDGGKDALKKCLTLTRWELCVHSERDKVKNTGQHHWSGMHVWTHRHQRPTPGGKLAASNQGTAATVTMEQSEDQLCHSAGCTKSQTSLAKAATVTSQPQAGKPCSGSWQSKTSRSLALTSCCHRADKLQEQPHTKTLIALPKGKRVPPRWTVQVHTSDV